MKSTLLSLALLPFLLTGCATGGYYTDYPGYYGPSYYDGPYYDGGLVGISYYDHNGYHGYHHYDSGGYAAGTTTHGSYHSSARVAGVSGGTHGSHVSRSASVSSGSVHFSGHHDQ